MDPDFIVKVIIPLALAIIMLSLGLGLTVGDFKRVVQRPRAVMIGGLNQLVLLPIIALALVLLFGLTGELAVGVMILAFCPGGVTSNIISKLAKGDVALSVSLTAIISLVSILTIPWLVAWAVAGFMGAEAPAVNIAKLAVSVFMLTALPVLIGVLIRHFAVGLANRIEPALSKLAVALFVLFVIAALASNWQLFIDNLGSLGPALITLNIILLICGALVARFFGLTISEAKTVAIETGIQNGAMGITLASLIAGQTPGLSAYALPAGIYSITMYAVTLPAVLWFRAR